jgi:hypothetical protein
MLYYADLLEHGVYPCFLQAMRLRCAVPKIPTISLISRWLPLYKVRLFQTHSQSTLLQVLIPLHFNSPRISVYKNPGEGVPPLYPKNLQLVTTATTSYRARTNSRNPNPRYALLHGSLDTRGVGSRVAIHHSPALSEVEGSLAIIPFRITSFAHPHPLTAMESHVCKKLSGVGSALRARIYLLSSDASRLVTPLTETFPRIRRYQSNDRFATKPCVSLLGPGVPRGAQ